MRILVSEDFSIDIDASKKFEVSIYGTTANGMVVNYRRVQGSEISEVAASEWQLERTKKLETACGTIFGIMGLFLVGVMIVYSFNKPKRR